MPTVEDLRRESDEIRTFDYGWLDLLFEGPKLKLAVESSSRVFCVQTHMVDDRLYV